MALAGIGVARDVPECILYSNGQAGEEGCIEQGRGELIDAAAHVLDVLPVDDGRRRDVPFSVVRRPVRSLIEKVCPGR